MGKIIKFDPNRRRPSRGGRDTRDWTRPEDYGVPPPPPSNRRPAHRKAAPNPHAPYPSAPASGVKAKLAVAAIILAGIATSLLGLT
jgi:hypothetical protein